MEIKDLTLKWSKLSKADIKSGYKSLRISIDCIPALYIGINNNNDRCLILSLPKNHRVDFQNKIRENLSIEYYKDLNYIVLLLTANDYFDLFDDLVLSIYNQIKDQNIVDEYSKTFIRTFYKWSEFFSDKKNDKLPTSVIKGLYGELIVLKMLVKNSDSTTINDVLNSWKGPFDETHDFVLDNKDIEVKTKDDTNSDIRISSEHQLENEIDKGLELLVVSIKIDMLNGFSIKDLVLEIKELIIDMLGDTTILLKALTQKNLTLKNIHQYDNFRYLPIKHIVYDCCKESFPKLIKSNIPPSISKISYNIRINSLDLYTVSEKRY